MTTTGELLAIVEELELVDVGDAASYLGEETEGTEGAAYENITLSFFSQFETLTGNEYSFRY